MERNKGVRVTAVVLAAGSGSRMHSATAKQYMELCGKPVIWYSLQAFEESPLVDRCILVVGAGDVEYARQEVVEKYGFQKVEQVLEGGAERYLSVQRALEALGEAGEEEEYVFIHDAARPLLSKQMIQDCYDTVLSYQAICLGVPVKDTIKITNDQGFIQQTPERSRLYAAQTPQCFSRALITEAYARLPELLTKLKAQGISITDDAMVVETAMDHPVKMVMGSYENIKITTPEDMEVVARFLMR